MCVLFFQPEHPETTATLLEKALFVGPCKKLAGRVYKRAARKLAGMLKNDAQLRKDIITELSNTSSDGQESEMVSTTVQKVVCDVKKLFGAL